jgi:signal transduction histidine kinase
MKLRRRTAEDFHDEMGNSLTRISVLTDVLKVKLNGTEKEVSHLVQQIKDNTTALYNGSRDIIWSLDSRNDALFEIAEHIKDIGCELFQDTTVELRYTHNIPRDDYLKLKLDYSRILTMIFKEAYSNILKHAGANRVDVLMELRDDRTLIVKLRDNGAGFSKDHSSKGNGLKNMQNRVSRMQGSFQVNTNSSEGTEINIVLDDIFVN